MEEKENLDKENEEKEKKKGFVAWWGGLTNPIKGLIIGGTTVALASAIVFPTLAATIWKKPVNPEPTPVKEWYEDETYIDRLGENDVGKTEKEILVNGQKHKVRLIGIDQDVDDKGNTIHTTWEFVNLISDKDGYSLAYQWNDTNSISSSNYDYTNSSIRYALTGKGENGGKSGEKAKEILVAQKGGKTWSKDEDYNKTILSMLPSSLTSKLKTVKKSVGTKSTYEVASYTDQLFMLSAIELGYDDPNKYDKGFGSIYKYYENATAETEATRIKKQVNNSEEIAIITKIPNDYGQAYKGQVSNYAGYNYKTDSTGGGIYWLRSPYSLYPNRAWDCDRDGGVYGNSLNVYDTACGVAPAFCL